MASASTDGSEQRIKQYLDDYADAFGLLEHIEFGNGVVHARLAEIMHREFSAVHDLATTLGVDLRRATLPLVVLAALMIAYPTFGLPFATWLLMGYYRSLPRELEEAAIIDGASYWGTLFYIFLPLSVPALATLTLFAAVFHWNAWFDGMILILDNSKYPIMTFLRTIVVDMNMQVLSVNIEDIFNLSDRSIRAANIVVATVPILLVYPFLQRYFIHGIRLGAVKG